MEKSDKTLEILDQVTKPLAFVMYAIGIILVLLVLTGICYYAGMAGSYYSGTGNTYFVGVIGGFVGFVIAVLLLLVIGRVLFER